MNRAQFIKGSLFGSLSLGALGTSNLVAQNHRLKTESSGIKVTDVKIYIHKKALFVKIETDAGISGWGEGDHDNTAVVAKAIEKLAKPIVLGQDPFESEYIWHQILYQGEDLGLSGLSTGALAGVDNALWDLKGKILGVPTYKLLGGCNVEKIKVYGSFGIGEGVKRMSSDMAAHTAADFVSKGYDTVKLRMQLRVLNRNPEPDPTEEYVKAVRKAIGDNISLFVDFNNGYTPGKAIELIKKLEEKYNVVLVEEPVHYHDYEGLRQCVMASSIRIAAGEHEFNRWDFKDLITKGMADVINLDVIKGGGISEMKKASVLAQTFEREVMFHNARPTLGTAATLQLVATIFNPARIQEWGGEREEMGLWPLFEHRFRFENGYLFVPDSPGIGLAVNEKEMKRFLVN